jgi:hypothetical protein
MPLTYSECITSMQPVLECRLGRKIITKEISAVGTTQIGKVAYKHTIQHMIMVLMCRAYGT